MTELEEETKQVNLNCPAKLLEAFDEAIKGRYGNRTAAIVQGMRLLLRELESEKASFIAKTAGGRSR